jgi:hypothetical protein
MRVKATKHMRQMAVELDRSYRPTWAGENGSWVEHYTSVLEDLANAILRGRIYISVESVSRSGMSRVLRIRWIENNRICRLPDSMLHIFGCDKTGRITGCGMDMRFAAWYNAATAIFPKADYRKLPQCNYLD